MVNQCFQKLIITGLLSSVSLCSVLSSSSSSSGGGGGGGGGGGRS